MPNPQEFKNAGAFLIGPGDSAYSLGEVFQIGRETVNDLRLEDPGVSRLHAVIQLLNDGRYWITDLQSKNGIKVQETLIKGACHPLVHGHQIRIGDFRFEFHDPSKDARGPLSAQAEVLVTEPRPLLVSVSLRWLILFDLVGSTSMDLSFGETEVHRIKEGWMREAQFELEEAGGQVNKFLGDGVFGYWIDREGTAAQVAKGMARLRAWQEATQHQRPFRMVIHFGRVCSGPPDVYGVESLTGRAVNLLFRLEKVASKNRWPRIFTEPVRSSLPDMEGVVELGLCDIEDFPEKFRLFEF
jgi:class 3 adenylate cyclase